MSGSIMTFLTSALARLTTFLDRSFQNVFSSRLEEKDRWLNWAWIFGLYGAGLLVWFVFLNYGHIPNDFHDWHDITYPRLTFLQDAIQTGQFPLHISNKATLGGVTDRYLSIPDAFLSPQALLLAVLNIRQFLVANVLLMYSLGFIGLLWLKRRFSLSLAALTLLTVLLNFNGHILAHYSVGHATWGGYFLFSWFAVLIFNLLDGDRSWAWVTKMALLLFAIFLQGSYHQYVWALIFLALIGIFSWRHFLPVVKAGGFALLLSAFRILPPTLLVGQFADNYEYIGGYPNLYQIWESMVNIFVPGAKISFNYIRSGIGLWEYDLYIGLAGAVFLFFFGVYRWLSNNRKLRSSQYLELALPMAGMLLLSLDKVYMAVRLLPIPLLTGERVASRLISVPFIFLVILAVIAFQRWLDERHMGVYPRLGVTAAMLLIGHDLWENIRAWQISTATLTFSQHVDLRAEDWYVANHADPAYIQAILIGAAISIVTLGILLLLSKREKQKVKLEIELDQVRVEI